MPQIEKQGEHEQRTQKCETSWFCKRTTNNQNQIQTVLDIQSNLLITNSNGSSICARYNREIVTIVKVL